MSSSSNARFSELVYRFRWPSALLALLFSFGVFAFGMGIVNAFTAKVDALGNYAEASPPQLFDMRTDIWFVEDDPALNAYYELEDRFVAEDIVFVGFEDTNDPWGAFGPESLATIARLTTELEKIPYVRSVRSLTSNPWIREAEVAPGEIGLLVGDLFENDPTTYTETERLERMVAILGADRAADIAGEEPVRDLLGPEADFDDFIGEPRLVGSIISDNGQATALQVQVLRPRTTEASRDEIFGADHDRHWEVGPSLYSARVQGEAALAIQALVGAETGYAFHVGGQPVVQQHFLDVGMADMGYTVLVFAMLGVALGLIFRRTFGVALPLIIVFSSIFGMMGSVFATGFLMNNLTAMLPNILTAVATADAVHLVTAYILLRPQHSDKRSLIEAVIRENALPVSLTSITTAIGFFSLASSSLGPLREFGVAAGVGTLLAYVLSMSVIPALLSLIPVGPAVEAKPVVTRSNRWSDALAAFVVRRRRPLIWAAAGTIFLAVAGMSQVHLTSDMRMMFGEDDPVSSDIVWIDENIGGTGDLEILFHGPEASEDAVAVNARQARISELEIRNLESKLTGPERTELDGLNADHAAYLDGRIAESAAFLARADAFERRLLEKATNPESPLRVIISIDSALSVLRKMNQVQNGNSGAHYRLPTEADISEDSRQASVIYDDIEETAILIPGQNASTLMSQYYLQYENGAKPTENLSTFITPDRRILRLVVRTSTDTSHLMRDAYDEVRLLAATEFPDIAGTPEQVASGDAKSTMNLTGRFYMNMYLFKTFATTLITSMSIALALITVLIGLVFRSARVALVSMVPNVLPIALPLGALGLLGIPLDGPAVIVATVALGVVVDDTIHFLTHYTQSIRNGESSENAIRMTFRHVGPALTWTTIGLVVGFSMLSLATFRPNVLIGLLGAIMISLAWLADFTLTPALLSALSDGESPRTRTLIGGTAAVAVGAALLVSSTAWAGPVPTVPQFNTSDPAAHGLQIAEYGQQFDSGWVDQYTRSEMTLIDQTGDTVTREFRLKLLEGNTGDKSLARFMSPAEVRGVGALTHEHPEATDDAWLYLPATRRVRRVAGANRRSSFLGTEFTYEDLSSVVVDRYDWKFIAEETLDTDAGPQPVYKIEAVPRFDDSGYSKLISYVHRDHWRAEQIVFFDKSGTKLKTLVASSWKQHHSRYWRAQHTEMTNHQTLKRTLVNVKSEFLDLSLYPRKDGTARNNLTEEDFTRRALENG